MNELKSERTIPADQQIRIEVILQHPEHAQKDLNTYYREGWRLHTCFPMIVEASKVQPTVVQALYCVLERAQRPLIDG